MSVKIMGMVWDLDNSLIDREEKYVLLAYADHADHKGYNIFPAIATICQKTGYKERAAQMITKSLASKGFLVADGRGIRGTNKWRIPLDKDGVRIAPAKNAPPQNDVDWGADGREDGGAGANAPESSETSLEPSEDIKLKNSLIEIISQRAYSIFSTDIEIWRNVKSILERPAVQITGEAGKKPNLDDPLKLVISGLSEKPKGGQFTLAEIWEDRFTKSFANQGIDVEFLA